MAVSRAYGVEQSGDVLNSIVNVASRLPVVVTLLRRLAKIGVRNGEWERDAAWSVSVS
jgi:hypothetical protein